MLGQVFPAALIKVASENEKNTASNPSKLPKIKTASIIKIK